MLEEFSDESVLVAAFGGFIEKYQRFQRWLTDLVTLFLIPLSQ
jgi:hypothetical protein